MPVSFGLDDIPAYVIDTDQASTLRHGQPLFVATMPDSKDGLARLQCGDELVAIVMVEESGVGSWKLTSKRNFNPA